MKAASEAIVLVFADKSWHRKPSTTERRVTKG